MRTILIVDDEVAARYGMRRALEGSFRIIEAASAREGREAISRETPAVILLDLIMPDEEGTHFLRSLRESGDETPVLIVSALDTARTAVEALKKGANDYIVKGFEIEELRKRSISRLTAWRSASASPSVSLCRAVGVPAVTIARAGAAPLMASTSCLARV